MINRVVLVGRLTRDPELRVSQSNVPVGTFNIAVNRSFKDKNGEQQADFINCVVFKKQAENVQQYLSKGSLAGIDGRLQTRSYEDKEGRTVYVTEVICDSVQFLEPKNKQENHKQDTWAQQNSQKSTSQQTGRTTPDYYQQGQIGQPQNKAPQPNTQNSVDDRLPY